MNINMFINLLANGDFLNAKKNTFGFVTSIYTSLAKVYDLLITISDDTNAFDIINGFSSILSTVYVLAGIFMIFRVTISFLVMLIDPDKVSDKQAGAGSIIKRVFYSVILLIVFYPGSFGLTFIHDLEDAILNSSLFNAMGSAETSLPGEAIEEDGIGYSNQNILIEDVYATNFYYPCVYAKIDGNDTSGYNFNDHIVIYISNYPFDGYNYNTIYSAKIDKDGKVPTGWYAKVGPAGTDIVTEDERVAIKTTTLDVSNFSTEKKVLNNSWYTKFFPEKKCPGISVIEYTNNGNKNTYIQFTSSVTNNSTGWRLETAYGVKVNSNNQVVAGEEVASYEAEVITNTENSSRTNATVTSNIDDEILEEAKIKLQLSDEAKSFARSLLNSFIDKLSASDTDVDEKLNLLLESNDANKDVYDLLVGNNPQITIDTLLAIIVAIIVIVYLIILIIDVIVRNLKLMILEAMAPIPIISFIDPKDKIFNNWFKMYLSVYVDLFIKLLCIRLGVSVLSVIVSSTAEFGTFKILLYYAGTFVFIKGLPAIINKIFGIDMSASSFKEIGKVAKTGLGIAAGGAIGAGATLGSAALAVSSAWKQKTGVGNKLLAAGSGLSSVLSGTLRGIGGGARGNVRAGLSVAQQNMNNRAAYQRGLSASSLVGASLLGGVGMDYASRVDRNVSERQDESKALSEFAEVKDQMDNAWTSSKYYNSLAGLKDENGNNLLDAYEMATARDLWMKAQLGQSDPNNYSDKENDLLRKFGETGNDNYCTIAGESGKESALRTALRNANQMRDGSSTVRNVVGDTEFTSYEQIDAATTAVKKERERVETEIGNMTTGNERYRQSVAARDTNRNNSGGNH